MDASKTNEVIQNDTTEDAAPANEDAAPANEDAAPANEDAAPANEDAAPELIPDKIFIVPYRDREPHKMVFMSVMPNILGDANYRILFIHQNDTRPFNRGGIKNIGFIYVKETWPNHWKNITLIFHDIDFLAYKKDQFTFDTRHGEINHFYGYKQTLGGIFAIKGADFEKSAGFPNIWTWGLEDNILLERVKAVGLKIVYSQFIHAQHNTKNIISLWHGWDRLLNPRVALSKLHHLNDSFKTVRNLKYEPVYLKDNAWLININNFDVLVSINSPLVKNAKVTNSRLNRTFKTWRGLEKQIINMRFMKARTRHFRRGLLI